MDINAVTDLCQSALTSGIVLAAPLLLVALLAGGVMGLLQAVTQIQDQTVALVPKLFAMSIALIVCMPWLLSRMVEFTREVFQNAAMP